MPRRLKARMTGTVTPIALARYGSQPSEIGDDDDRYEGPKDEDELALGDQVGLAGFVNEFGDLAHGAMDRQVLELHVNRQSEQ